MANISDFLRPNATPTPTGGGGGGIAETAIFTQSGTWLVPQSVQDEIAAEGHAEVGLLMVGGGATAASGEVVSELYQLTTADYDPMASWADPNQPEISVVVGAAGSASGITDSMMVNLVAATHANTTWIGGGSAPAITIPLVGARTDAAGYPFIFSVRFTITPNIGTSTLNNGAWGGTGTAPVRTGGNTGVWTFDPARAWDGTQGFSISGNAHTNGGASIRGNTNGSISIFDNNGAVAGGRITFSNIQVIYESADPLPVKVARGGTDVATTTSLFLNNPTSTEGYFGGYGRFNSTRPNSGAGGNNPQSGYVQIFYT